MRPKENYSRFVGVSLFLTISILVLFQIYIFREPSRIASDEASQKKTDLFEGHLTFLTYCALCHGKDGEGIDAPALNDKTFLDNTDGDTIFSIASSGVPGTEMPAWNQAHGGPLTDQQIRQVATYIKDWEGSAPDRQAMAMAGDPVDGLVIYNGTCIVCHGEDGSGTERAPALNDPVKLAQFDDEWYVDTIKDGRPAKGMPTWGTVLSPEQINSLVALLRAWEHGEVVAAPGPEEALAEVLHLLEHGDMHGAEHALEDLMGSASSDLMPALTKAMNAIDAGDAAAAQAAIQEAQSLLGAETPSDTHAEGSG
jgi:cytochrome c oxidase cbb3-type subunit 3